MKIIVFLGILLSFSSMPSYATESAKGWKSIFNGVDLSGWTAKIKGETFGKDPLKTFVVKDKAITVSYENYDKFDNKFGHLFYKEKLSSYILKLEYRFLDDQLPDGPYWAYYNSGVMIHSQNPNSMALNQDFPVSVEVQLLGAGIFDQRIRTTANVCTPGTHVSIKGVQFTDHCILSSSDRYFGNEWITLEVEVKDNKLIRHKINGMLVFEYNNPVLDTRDPNAKKLIANGSPVELTEGYISLQSESHPVQFRDIYLKKLK